RNTRARGPVPVRQSEIVVAGELAANGFEIKEVRTMPRQEPPVSVDAVVVVYFSLLGPVAAVARRQCLHLADGVSVSLNDRIVSGEVRDVASGGAVLDFVVARFASTGGDGQAGEPHSF